MEKGKALEGMKVFDHKAATLGRPRYFPETEKERIKVVLRYMPKSYIKDYLTEYADRGPLDLSGTKKAIVKRYHSDCWGLYCEGFRSDGD